MMYRSSFGGPGGLNTSNIHWTMLATDQHESVRIVLTVTKRRLEYRASLPEEDRQDEKSFQETTAQYCQQMKHFVSKSETSPANLQWLWRLAGLPDKEFDWVIDLCKAHEVRWGPILVQASVHCTPLSSDPPKPLQAVTFHPAMWRVTCNRGCAGPGLIAGLYMYLRRIIRGLPVWSSYIYQC